MPVLLAELLDLQLVGEGDDRQQEGDEADLQADPVPGLPVQLEELDLGGDAEVVDGPVDEVEELGDDVKESGELFLPVEGEV